MCVCSNRPTTRMWTAARQCVSRVVCCARLRVYFSMIQNKGPRRRSSACPHPAAITRQCHEKPRVYSVDPALSLALTVTCPLYVVLVCVRACRLPFAVPAYFNINAVMCVDGPAMSLCGIPNLQRNSTHQQSASHIVRKRQSALRRLQARNACTPAIPKRRRFCCWKNEKAHFCLK